MLQSRREFEEWVYGWWCEGLDHLDVLWIRSRQEAVIFHDRFQTRALKAGDMTFEALRELHARAIRTTAEIATLLRGGHGEAAFARWRTLHEIAVIMEFLLGAEEQVAERYMAHVFSVLGSPDLDGAAEELERKREIIPEVREALTARYGARFFEEYGWALPAFPEKQHVRQGRRRAPQVHFADIERVVGQSSRRIHYGLASEHIHASPFGLISGVRVDPATHTPTLVSTPVGDDLVAAGVRTSESLLHATLCLLAQYTNTHTVISRSLLRSLAKSAAAAWQRSHEQFVAEHGGQPAIIRSREA